MRLITAQILVSGTYYRLKYYYLGCKYVFSMDKYNSGW